ncbi:MAG TPA: hypothetical protein VEL74_12855 [Thermoanaerobaculia bacterium]|nr:hypothetical protein [Thermoanaerobaculia bacterium]
MANLPEVLCRNREAMRRLLASYVVPPWEAEPILLSVCQSMTRRQWREVAEPDRVLLQLLDDACQTFAALRRWHSMEAALDTLAAERGGAGDGAAAGV